MLLAFLGKEGDTYRIGALMPGTLIHHMEKYPGHGATMCIQAGAHATILRRIGSKVIVKLPNKGQEVAFDEKCFCTVGKVSNTNNYLVNRLCPQRQRWKGIRPSKIELNFSKIDYFSNQIFLIFKSQNSVWFEEKERWLLWS